MRRLSIRWLSYWSRNHGDNQKHRLKSRSLRYSHNTIPGEEALPPLHPIPSVLHLHDICMFAPTTALQPLPVGWVPPPAKGLKQGPPREGATLFFICTHLQSPHKQTNSTPALPIKTMLGTEVRKLALRRVDPDPGRSPQEQKHRIRNRHAEILDPVCLSCLSAFCFGFRLSTENFVD